MIKTNTVLIHSLLILMLASCGGTHGHFETFGLSTTVEATDAKIKSLLSDSIKIIPSDRKNYKDVFLVQSTSFKVFTYRYVGNLRKEFPVQIALVYVKKYGRYYTSDELPGDSADLAIDEFYKHFVQYLK